MIEVVCISLKVKKDEENIAWFDWERKRTISKLQIL